MKHILLAALFFLVPGIASAQFFPAGTQQPGVTIDATVTHTATPDAVHLHLNCPMQTPMKRSALKAHFANLHKQVKALVGTDGTVRRPTSNIYSVFMGPAMEMPAQGTAAKQKEEDVGGDMSIAIRGIKPEAVSRVNAGIETMNCTASWDARLVHTGKYIKEYTKDLRAQIAEKKEGYEMALGRALGKMTGMYIYTSIDPLSGAYMYPGGYDPVENIMDVQTMMSVTYVLE